jgi:DNA-binding transcriptional regulator YbjK
LLLGCDNRVDTDALKLALKSDTTFIKYDELRDSVLNQLHRDKYFTSWDLLQRKERTNSLTKDEQAQLDVTKENYAVAKRFKNATHLLTQKYPDLKKMPTFERDKLLQEVRSSIQMSSNNHLDMNTLQLALESDATFTKYMDVQDSITVYALTASTTYRFWDIDSLQKSAQMATLTAEGQAGLQILLQRHSLNKQMGELSHSLEMKYPDLKTMPIPTKMKLYEACRKKTNHTYLTEAASAHVKKLKASSKLPQK